MDINDVKILLENVFIQDQIFNNKYDFDYKDLPAEAFRENKYEIIDYRKIRG